MSQTDLVNKLEQLLPHLFNSQNVSGEPYLRFQLTPGTLAVVSMEQVQESLVIPTENITPIPNLPESVIGLTNIHNSVFCVVDLGNLLNISLSQLYPQAYHVIVIRLSLDDSPREWLLGLSVHRILGLTRLSSDCFQSPQEDIPKQLTPFLSGCFYENQERILAFDLKTIIQACPLINSQTQR
ncbi:CheW protein [Gloeothece citriformis PCC 7424]|uniref:CheW protein n=1 Tax=Gloeothece citriformis (strain PCC 7424) TaxID=65393 RepID=B7KBI8_GLOC7|nr:chemotaxis protein CheW [Gloeothece citriformis]ACK72966.1 CheW protein [Gloeothece citriformis PCC 7424]